MASAKSVAPPPLPYKAADLVSSTNLKGSKDYGKYYITTAINYTNGPPHIGHAYEVILADTIARYHRMSGKQVFFLTGTDEHGQKIANSAEAKNMTPKELCDSYVEKFKSLNDRLMVANDEYIRTTDDYHEESCRQLWKRCAEAGDIELGTYEGWYDVKEEAHVTESKAKQADYKDSAGNPLKRISEPCYNFKLGKFRDRLLKHIEAHPEFIQPENRRTEVLEMLEEPLDDLCVSRTTFSWGITMPEGFDKQHVMYVWFDALTNYVSATKLLLDEKHERTAFWPADVHIIGKDITRFHCIYWPAMLWSGKLSLPKVVAGHGFVLDALGKKMSKAVGNVVDPNDMLDKYLSDTFRFYLCQEATYGSDLKFSEASLQAVHNSLADTAGNLAQRATLVLKPPFNGHIPDMPKDRAGLALPFDVKALIAEVDQAFKSFDTRAAAYAVMGVARDTNKWVSDLAPWLMKKPEEAEKRQATTRLLVEAVYILAHFLSPFLPVACTCIFKKLDNPPVPIPDLSPDFNNLRNGTVLQSGDWMEGFPVLFPKFEHPAPPAPVSKKKADKADKGKQAPGKQAGGKQAGGKQAGGDQAAAVAEAMRLEGDQAAFNSAVKAAK